MKIGSAQSPRKTVNRSPAKICAVSQEGGGSSSGNTAIGTRQRTSLRRGQRLNTKRTVTLISAVASVRCFSSLLGVRCIGKEGIGASASKLRPILGASRPGQLDGTAPTKSVKRSSVTFERQL